MKLSLPLKLGIGVVLLFAVVITACLLWTPVRIRYYISELNSSNIDKRIAAIDGLISIGDKGKEELITEFPDGREAALLLLTCCVSLLLFPLSFKSLSSMRKLQELQPHIEKVRTQHKDNPQKLNKEIMEIYRRYKVNPMGGCFPMLLQMPIFIALYQTLMRSVELKGAQFLWIKDLSMPDAAFHLPFTMPFLGNAINILPILMIGAMIIQQKMSQVKTSAAQTEQQKMMSTVMPVVFGVIFYSLPSGLVLYWLTNTLLTSFLQFFSLRKA